MTDQQLASYTAHTTAELGELRHGLVTSLHDAGLDADRIDEVVVMASELVANVLGHTDSAASVTVTADPNSCGSRWSTAAATFRCSAPPIRAGSAATACA